MAEIIITGASGFLGSHLMRLAAQQGRDVLGLVFRHHAPLPGRYERIDLTDSDAVRALVQKESPRAIIHTAAITSPDACEADRGNADALNVTATGLLAMVAFMNDAHLTFISTDLVFNGEDGMYNETDPPNPVNHYGITKAQAEHFVRAASPDFAIVRPSFLYGIPMAEHHQSFSQQLLVQLKQGQSVKVFNDQFRSPIPASALADAVLELSDLRLGGIWHIGGPDRVSRADFARALASVVQLDPALLEEISMDDVALPAARPRDVSLNTEKARHRLQSALPSLTDGFHFLYGKGG